MSDLFINADLILTSGGSLHQIIDGFGDEVLVLHSEKVDGNTTAWLEVSLDVSDAESTAMEFCRLAEGLSERGKMAWIGCESRCIDIGFESNAESSSFSTTLLPETVQRVAALGMGLTITVYPIRDNS